MIFLHPELFWLLILAPLAGLGQALILRRRRRWQRSWQLKTLKTDKLRPILLGLAVALAVVALARPVWDPKPLTRSGHGQDTVFLVDVSRSMETLDLNGQSRLTAVRQVLSDLAATADGDRFALVAFAGTSVVKSPLTADLSFFRQAVDQLDSGATSRGGTLLGDAIRDVQAKFLKKDRPVTLWILTDGGDQESFPVEAAKAFGAAGGRLFIWGVGTLAGGPVPERGVSSALNEGLLKEVTTSVSGGQYWGTNTPIWRLELEYKTHRQTVAGSGTTRMVYQEGAWWLLWPIGILLALDAFLAKRRSL